MKPVVILLVVCALSVSAYAQTTGAPEFEVASIRISDAEVIRDSYTPTLDVTPGATLRIANRSLRDVILLAYNIGVRQLVGPTWLVDEPIIPIDILRFDIVA